VRFSLKTLLLVVLLFGGLAAFYTLNVKRSGRHYHGYFHHDQRFHALVSRVDPAVKIQGTGGGGGGSELLMAHFTHSLISDRPIGEELLQKLRSQLRQDMQAQGIKILEDKDANAGDSNYPVAGVRLITWGFQSS
jgi:hypothetical protein